MELRLLLADFPVLTRSWSHPFNTLPLGSVFFLAAAVLCGEWLLPWRRLCPQRAGHPPRSSVRALRAQPDPLALLLGSNTNLRKCQVKQT